MQNKILLLFVFSEYSFQIISATNKKQRNNYDKNVNIVESPH
jgi:hypothetical protein